MGDASENKPTLLGRVCYEFNHELDSKYNDTRCTHCRKFMTLYCEHITEFIEDEY